MADMLHKPTLVVIPYDKPNKVETFQKLQQIPNLEIVYLTPLWGLIASNKFIPSMLRGFASMNERELMRQTSLNIRSWLMYSGAKYGKIILINYGKTPKYWNKSVLKLPMTKNIKVIRWLPQGKSLFYRKLLKACESDGQK